MLSKNEILQLVKGNKKRLSCKVDKLGASSKRNTFLVESNGQKYKLRKCLSIEDAKNIEKRILQISHLKITPEYLGRYNEWLVFSYLDLGEAEREESNEVWFNLGKSIGLLEQIPCTELDISFAEENKTVSNENFQDYLMKALTSLACNDYLNKLELENALNQIKLFFEGNVQYGYGYLDLLPGNVLVDKNRILFADEEGIARTIKGLSLIRPIDIWKSQTPEKGMSEESRKEFLRGYQSEKGDVYFFEKNKEVLGVIYYTLKSYDSLINSGTTSCSIRRLKWFISNMSNKIKIKENDAMGGKE